MRANLYILIIALFATSSCNTIQKMVDQGRYDEAFTFSVKKLAGKKNKKTKYVFALEEAYIRLNERDLNEISFLMKKGAPASWDRVIHIYKNLDRRQNLVRSISPLEAKNGYVAHFELRDYNEAMVEAMELSADYHYTNAINHATKARSGDKRAARRAMTSLNEISKYYNDYKEANAIRDEMHIIGTENISIEIVNIGNRYFGDQAMDHLYSLNIQKMNSFWEKFHRYDSNQSFDDYVVIELSNINLGSEKEFVNNSSFEKEILDGYDIIEEKIKVKVKGESKPVMTKDGTPIDNKKPKDKYVTKTKTTKVPKYKMAYAEIIEIKREKLGELYGKIKVFRNGDETPYYQKTFNVNFDFYDEAIRYRGNRKALPQNQCARIDNFIDDFPSDYAMVDNLACKFRDAVSHEINRYDFLYN